MFPNKDPAGSNDAESRTTPPSSGSGKKKVTIASFDKGCNRKKCTISNKSNCMIYTERGKF